MLPAADYYLVAPFNNYLAAAFAPVFDYVLSEHF